MSNKKYITFPVTGLILNFLIKAIIASDSKTLPSPSQKGYSNGCRHKQQWSNGSRLKVVSSSVDVPDLLPPYNVVHSVYVKYLKKCYWFKNLYIQERIQ